MIQFFVDDTQLELSDGVVIALTKQSNDLSDFNNKRANLSNTIKVPESIINNAALGQAYDLASAGVDRDWMEAKLIQDYEEIISCGKCKLVGKEGKYYLLTIYWGNIDLSSIIGDKTLRDLDLDDLTHTWNLVNVSRVSFGAHPTISGRDLNYPLLNTHDTEELRSGANSSNYIYAARLLPFVSLSRILKQIAIDNGLTLSGIDKFTTPAAITELNEHILNDYWIPVNDRQPAFNFSQDPIINNASNFIMSSDFIIPVPTLKFEDTEGVDVEEYTFLDGVYNTNLAGKLSTKASVTGVQSLILHHIVYAQISTDGGVTWTNTFADTSAAFVAYATVGIDNSWYAYDLITAADIDPVTEWKQIDHEPDIPLVYAATAGDLIRFKSFISPQGSYELVLAWHSKGSEFAITKDIIVFGDDYPVGINMPEIKQIDILKFVAGITCSLIDVEDGTNIVKFTKFSDIVNSATTTQDYSTKVEKVKIKSYHPKLAQNNYLNYDNDSEVAETFAQGNLQITGDNTLNQEMELYKAPFSASINEAWDYAGTTAVQIARYPIIKVWNEAFNNVKGRIYRITSVTGTIYIGTTADPTNNTSVKYVAYFANSQYFSNLGYLSNYDDYRTVMEDYKACEVLANMTGSDFKAIDLYKSLYVEQEGAYFFILEVKEYIKGKKTLLSLLKL